MCAEGVDARCQCLSTDESPLDICARSIVVGAPRGIDVRGLHIEDSVGHFLRGSPAIIRRIGLASELRRCPRLGVGKD
jgi:hypothetical protein